ncbi:uncharacterized protein I303_108157 [Kwoniella dejecticola CBS 10117]|uniref:Uncharacterized protein n=1 Tax=Kwoniella dejecticola CBS 10117 TaxID=1296121 RepID=A0A1A5ZY60_9TREE|nr:uncharacterized protein I303_07517 [Kwoniella dejecticola CBS 10117]OBR82750.1 hypothetical protein I303_07517 [Kwoniella dejecticola CBS 10117]
MTHSNSILWACNSCGGIKTTGIPICTAHGTQFETRVEPGQSARWTCSHAGCDRTNAFDQPASTDQSEGEKGIYDDLSSEHERSGDESRDNRRTEQDQTEGSVDGDMLVDSSAEYGTMSITPIDDDLNYGPMPLSGSDIPWGNYHMPDSQDGETASSSAAGGRRTDDFEAGCQRGMRDSEHSSPYGQFSRKTGLGTFTGPSRR